MLSSLTARERQVFVGLAQGRFNREIADELRISVKTVDTHRSKIIKKLQVRNNAELVRYAIKHGAIDVNGKALPEGSMIDAPDGALPSSNGAPCG